MKKLLFAIALLGMAMSCTMVNDFDSVKSGRNIIKVTSDSETRMAIKDAGDGVFTHNWEKGDAIVIYDGATPLKYEIVGEGGDTKADFAGEALSGNTKLYPAFYPYADCIDITEGQNLFVYEFPSVIKKAAENYEQNVMIGLCDGSNVQMKNCASYVKLAYSTNIISFVDSIKIEAVGGEPLCGKFRFGIDGATGVPFAIADESLTAENSKVVVKFDAAEMLTTNATTFYVALPPVELTQGLKFTFYGDFNGESELEYTSSTATLERNVVLDMEKIVTNYRLDIAEVTIGSGDPVVYENVNKAFESALGATEPVLIKMLNSGSFTAKVDYETEDITIDLNGKTLKSVGTKRINLEGKDARLTIVDSSENADGTWTQTADGSYVVLAHAGTITLESGIISHTEASTSACVYVSGPESVYTMNGGKMHERVVGLDQATININGGEIDARNGRGIYLSAVGDPAVCKVTVNVTGGKVHAKNDDAIYCGYSSGIINVTGGEISSEHGRGIYTVGTSLDVIGATVSSVDSAAIASYRYCPVITIKDAIITSNNGNADANGNDVDQKATIGLRGTSKPGIILNISGDTKVTNTNASGRAFYLRANAATCPTTAVISGGEFEGSTYCIYCHNNTDVTITGGSFINTNNNSTVYTGSKSGSIHVSGGYFWAKYSSTRTTLGRYSADSMIEITGGNFSNTWSSAIKLPTGYVLKDDGASPYKYYVVAE